MSDIERREPKTEPTDPGKTTGIDEYFEGTTLSTEKVTFQREGLPADYRMRHDEHYVDELVAAGSMPPLRLVPTSEIEGATASTESLVGLVDSIQAYGVLQPLLVRRRHGRYELLAGSKRIEHAQVIHPDDLPRFAELGVIPGIQGIFACSDGPWVDERLGDERTRERGYIWRSMIDSGAVVQNGTDPPVEEIDPIASFDCSVTRRLPDGSIFNADEAMTRMQALASYTINNAHAAFEEDVKGTLTPGKYADITVLSKDILTIPDDEIRDTEVVYTIIGGEVKYEAR